MNLRLKEFRELIQSVETNCNSRVDFTKFEDVRKLHIGKIEELTLKIKDHTRKFSGVDSKISDAMNKLRERIALSDDRNNEAIDKLRKRIKSLNEMLKSGEFGGKGSGGNEELIALLRAQF